MPPKRVRGDRVESKRDAVDRKRRRGPSTKKPNDAESDSQSACPVCLDDEPESKSAFPCGHTTCSKCFIDPRLTSCPLCRTGKDGTSGLERQRREEQSHPGGGSGGAVVHVFHFRGGDGNHPFDSNNLSISSGPLPRSFSDAVRQAAYSSSTSNVNSINTQTNESASGEEIQNIINSAFRQTFDANAIVTFVNAISQMRPGSG